MATTFLEPGGDADFAVAATSGFWKSLSGVPAVATDFVHGAHIKSIKYRPANSDAVITPNAVVADAGARISFYLYISAGPSAAVDFVVVRKINNGSNCLKVTLTSGRTLQLLIGGSNVQMGSNGSTLSTGQWYRISLAYTITSTTVNEFRLFVNGVLDISVTNATLTNIVSSCVVIGNTGGNSTFDLRSSDHYFDNSNALTDTGDIWVTAKRPNANGTTNAYSTQIGSGGSGYGSGRSPQVNERPLSTTNGWSDAALHTEEYNIESASTGDIDISAATIVDYMGWVSADCAVGSETNTLILNGTNNNISITTTTTVFTKIAGSSTYPAGTGADIGMKNGTNGTSGRLYECGIIVAFIPAAAVSIPNKIYQYSQAVRRSTTY